MGDFGGHMIPGLAIFIFGIYQGVLTSLSLLRDQLSPHPPTSQRTGWLWQLPVGALLKVLFGTISFLHEISSLHATMIVTDYNDPYFSIIFPMMWQHFTMFTVFILSGLVDLVSRVCLAKRRLGLEVAAQILATLVLVPLMFCHLWHMEGLEKQSHILLLFSISLLALAMTIELWVPNQPQLWLIKTWLFLVTGTWLMHMAFMLFYPVTARAWHHYTTENIMFLTTFFCWHLVAGALILGVIYTFSILWHQYCGLAPDLGGNNEAKYHLCLPETPDEELQEAELEGHIQRTLFFAEPTLGPRNFRVKE
ncbi:transmembrane epididymal protein 1 [Phascolarctos cinereus]|uniref:Transmembrane epididymal protein 1 n=1 Tax=Phascolarctos cinereus TaxID=38626 RepID=A0A6P5K5F5_PHACI|nr:transmembrane epididymal protein 1 [Phascolarctos cinereus]